MENKKTTKNLQYPPFRPYARRKRSTLEFGDYYQAKFKLPFAQDLRFVRVWLPPEYEENPNQRFPVIYFSDGQNLVDRALTAYGDWHLDKVAHSLSEEGIVPPILVGLDCPKDALQRSNELNPPFAIKPSMRHRHTGPDKPIGDQYIDYMADVVRPLINQLFRTDARKEATGIGGSSMGGIMAFYAYFRRPEVFGFSLAFSIPAFFYQPKRWEELVKSWDIDPKKHGKLAIFVGGEGFEKEFTPGVQATVSFLREAGYGDDQLEFYFDPTLPHHEESWSKYATPAMRFWLQGLE